MRAGRARGSGLLFVSLAVHALALVGVSAMALRAPLTPLFVDLTQDGSAVAGTSSDGNAATATRPRPAEGNSPARRMPSAPPGAVGPISAPPPVRPATERPSEASVSPSVPAPAAASSIPTPITPAAPAETPTPAVKAAADVTPAPDDSGARGKPDGSGTIAPNPAFGAASGRPAGRASETDGAGPGVSAPGGARLVLALPGDGRGGAPAEYGPYLAKFRRSVEDALVYPLAARRQGLAGRVELDVLLEPSGRVTAVEVYASSSHGVLDEAGIAAVRSLPLLPLPEGLPRRPLRIRLPLDFQLH